MNNTKSYHLFVYGSLLSGFKSPAYDYISRYFTLISPAKIKGRLYDMGELDDYEGVTIEPGETQLYKRELSDVFHENTITRAWVYWYNRDVSGKPEVESGDILRYHQQKNN